MNFYNILFAMGLTSCCFLSEQVELFNELPVELVILILSYLDAKSLAVMSRLNKRLFYICKSDKQLRTKIRRQLRKENKEQMRKLLNPVKVTVIRNEAVASTSDAFVNRNARKGVIARKEIGFLVSNPINKQGRKPIQKRKADSQVKNPGISKRLRI